MEIYKLYFLPLIFFGFEVSAAKYDHIWPYPQSLHQSDNYLMINPSHFSIESTSKCDLIHLAIRRHLDRMFIQDCSRIDPKLTGDYLLPKRNDINSAMDMYNSGGLANLTIKFDGECEQWPNLKMKESYQLKIERGGAVLEAESVWGILRGLETFSQLLKHTGRDQYQINLAQIDDFPRFAHRGLLIDSSRHFLPLKLIYETLDLMEMNKFNVLHWHLVDDQSFPFVSESFPELSERGAFNQKMIYSPESVIEILEYARIRGIRVLPEFDTPGHSLSWGKSQPGLLTKCYDKSGVPDGTFGPIDPSNPQNYDFMKKLLSEVSQRFPDQYIHLGGDEVPFDCWESNPEIQEFMKQNKIANESVLESYYIDKVVKIVKNLDKSYIVWQEVLDNNVTLKPDTVVHVWIRGSNLTDPAWEHEMTRVVKAGYHTILSAPWYLDWVSWGQDWVGYYEVDPLEFPATDEEKRLVIGGEACIWGEYVNGANLISKTWPRASSIAERLWSNSSLKSAEKARPRFHAFECRLERLGYRVEPIDGPGFCECDYAVY